MKKKLLKTICTGKSKVILIRSEKDCLSTVATIGSNGNYKC